MNRGDPTQGPRRGAQQLWQDNPARAAPCARRLSVGLAHLRLALLDHAVPRVEELAPRILGAERGAVRVDDLVKVPPIMIIVSSDSASSDVQP